VLGIWESNISWDAQVKFVSQYRDDILVGIWRITGVDMVAHRDAILILAPQGHPFPLESGDVLMFKDDTKGVKDNE